MRGYLTGFAVALAVFLIGGGVSWIGAWMGGGDFDSWSAGDVVSGIGIGVSMLALVVLVPMIALGLLASLFWAAIGALVLVRSLWRSGRRATGPGSGRGDRRVPWLLHGAAAALYVASGVVTGVLVARSHSDVEGVVWGTAVFVFLAVPHLTFGASGDMADVGGVWAILAALYWFFWVRVWMLALFGAGLAAIVIAPLLAWFAFVEGAKALVPVLPWAILAAAALIGVLAVIGRRRLAEIERRDAPSRSAAEAHATSGRERAPAA